MSAIVNGPATWNLESTEDIDAPEYEKKYKEVLTELSKFVGAAANKGDIEAYSFLVHYCELILRSGFEVLKEVYGEEKQKTFDEFCKKVGISKN
jgi:hypothetical protein